jgi:hypothetical protein
MLLSFLHMSLLSFYCTIANCRCSIWQESERAVTKKEGIEFAREYGCLFLECSAKTKVNVEQCFEELVLKVCHFQRHLGICFCICWLLCSLCGFVTTRIDLFMLLYLFVLKDRFSTPLYMPNPRADLNTCMECAYYCFIIIYIHLVPSRSVF